MCQNEDEIKRLLVLVNEIHTLLKLGLSLIETLSSNFSTVQGQLKESRKNEDTKASIHQTTKLMAPGFCQDIVDEIQSRGLFSDLVQAQEDFVVLQRCAQKCSKTVETLRTSIEIRRDNLFESVWGELHGAEESLRNLNVTSTQHSTPLSANNKTFIKASASVKTSAVTSSANTSKAKEGLFLIMNSSNESDQLLILEKATEFLTEQSQVLSSIANNVNYYTPKDHLFTFKTLLTLQASMSEDCVPLQACLAAHSS
mmetsp:Transcript_34023/g.61379  ORF Transcript_34023/g.61379 Transcript_34023/m.61379 type:complete len:256 (-) Transcript_34023:184-951(-)